MKQGEEMSWTLFLKLFLNSNKITLETLIKKMQNFYLKYLQ